jgi:dihydrofolate reductase
MTAGPRLEVVAAVAANGVIGRGGQLPWRLPDDLRHFKALTLGHPVIMGRRTFESIGRPLPGRLNVVVSATLAAPPAAGVEVAASLEHALRVAASSSAAGPVFVIGGAALYEAAIPRAAVLHLTEVDADVEGDAVFPAWDRSRFGLSAQVDHPADDRHEFAFRFCTYERLKPSEE